MKILICGDRNYSNYDKIVSIIKRLKDEEKELIIIEGGASGADELAKKASIELEIEFREYKADWKRYGRSAGPKRNQQMLDCESPELVIAFHENIEKSKGTKDMLNRASKANIKTLLYS